MAGRSGVCRVCPVDAGVLPVDVEVLPVDPVDAEVLPTGAETLLIEVVVLLMIAAVEVLTRVGAPGVLLGTTVLGVRRL